MRQGLIHTSIQTQDPETSLSMLCPALSEHGTCQNAYCQFEHSAFTCDTCGFLCSNSAEMDEHFRSEAHIKKTQGQSKTFMCTVCDRRVGGKANWNQHIVSRRHLMACHGKGVAPSMVEPEEMTEVPGHTFCVPCNVHILDRYWNGHIRKPLHLSKASYASFKVALEDTEVDRNGVALTGDFDFGIVDLNTVPTGRSVRKGTVTVTSVVSRISLIAIYLTSSKAATSNHSL
jgi:helicase MOV-10